MSALTVKTEQAIERYIVYEADFLMGCYRFHEYYEPDRFTQTQCREKHSAEQVNGNEAIFGGLARRYADILTLYLQYREETVYVLQQEIGRLQNENSSLFEKYYQMQRFSYDLERYNEILKTEAHEYHINAGCIIASEQLLLENAQLREKAQSVLQIVESQQRELDYARNDLRSYLTIKQQEGIIKRLKDENALFYEALESLAFASQREEICKRHFEVTALKARLLELEKYAAETAVRHEAELYQTKELHQIEISKLMCYYLEYYRTEYRKISEVQACTEDYLRQNVDFLRKQLENEQASHYRDLRVFEITYKQLANAQYEAIQIREKTATAIGAAKRRYECVANYLEDSLHLIDELKRLTNEYAQQIAYLMNSKSYQAEEIASLQQANLNMKCGTFGVLYRDAEITRILDGIYQENRDEVYRILREIEAKALTAAYYKESDVSATEHSANNAEGEDAHRQNNADHELAETY